MANDDPNILTLQYSSSMAWESEVIRRLCHSAFSHVDIQLNGEGLLGASGGPQTYKIGNGQVYHDPGGVQIRPSEPWPYKIKQTIRIKTDKAEAIRTRARTQIGKPFDTGALYEFLSEKPGDRDWRDTTRWFCSELAVWSSEIERCFPWQLLVAKNRVSPADSLLVFNPLIFDEDITTLRAMLTGDTGVVP
jgi:hypothetical protein